MILNVFPVSFHHYGVQYLNMESTLKYSMAINITLSLSLSLSLSLCVCVCMCVCVSVCAPPPNPLNVKYLMIFHLCVDKYAISGQFIIADLH